MRVVVTGASGDVGSCIVAELLGRGHEVHRVSREQDFASSAGYRHTADEVWDADALVRVMAYRGAQANAVVHLAPITPSGKDAAANIGAVLDAMQRAGVPRLVSMSSVLTNVDNPAPGLVQRAVTLGINTLVVRAATIMGRDSAGVTQRRLAAPVILGIKNGRNIAQFVHPDDVARFVGDAVEHLQWTGRVDLAASDTLALRQVAAILGKRYVEVAPDRDRGAAAFGAPSRWGFPGGRHHPTW